MKTDLDKSRIARVLRARRRGKVAAGAGYFGARQLLAEVHARFRVPVTGGRSTDPTWTEQRLVRLKPETLRRLKYLASRLDQDSEVNVTPMQLAALILEKTAEELTEKDIDTFLSQAGKPD